MGCASSAAVSPEEKEKREITRGIDEELKKEKKKFGKEVKLLLLGAGESGKSTISKQMKIIHLKGFTQDELISYKPIIHVNILESIKALVIASQKFGYDLESQNHNIANQFANMNVLESEFTPQQAASIKQLWKDGAIQKAWERANEFQLPEVATYLFENIDRISSPNYIPDQNDCLRCRARTTGIIETEFILQGTTFKMVDVGGQRSERKKWIHCFENVTAVLFCAALSEYDQKLYEDESVNRMMEALSLFEQTCQTKWFDSASIILFLNKSDLFQEKIAKKDLKCCFPDYNGGCDFLNGTQFIEQKFLERNKSGKAVYTHITCATNTENIRFVFTAVKDIIINKYLAATGFA